MAETYDPKIYIDGYAASQTSTFAQTTWSDDSATLPVHNLGGWAQRTWSGDTSHTDNNRRGRYLAANSWS